MPISDCEVRDPRTRRTRQLLQSALRALMKTRSFDEISVQDIAEAATVNRATFYDHYTDKHALVEATVSGGFHKLLHERNVSFGGPCQRALGSLVLATCDYLTETHAGLLCQRQIAFQPLVDAAMTSAIQRVLVTGIPPLSRSVLTIDVVAAAASWAIYGAVKQWFSKPVRPPAEKLVKPLVRMVLPMVAGVESPKMMA